MLNFPAANNTMDMKGLDKKFAAILGVQLDIRDKLKPIEWRLTTLEKHIGQADVYVKYKGQKTLTTSEQILFTAAHDYLKGMMNGKTALPVKAWKAEHAKLTAGRKALNQRYVALKDEVKEVGKSERAFTVSCGRNSGNSNAIGRRKRSCR